MGQAPSAEAAPPPPPSGEASSPDKSTGADAPAADEIMAARSEEAEESRPPTSKLNFAELDDAFLQTQTRIWLGEVLQKRFEESTELSDFLADGLILYELYQAFEKMLADGEESDHKAVEQDLAGSRDNIQKNPYPNVESLLRICQILGVEDHDFFTSSDAIDKINTQKVCMCLRSLSKQARLRKLNVPDFDTVTYSISNFVSLPTDMVENQQSNLEESTTSAITSSDQATIRELIGKHQQEESGGLGSEASDPKSDTSHNDVGDNLNNDGVAEAIGTSSSLFGEHTLSPVNSGSPLDSTLSSINSGSEINYQSQENHVSIHAKDTSIAESVAPLDGEESLLAVRDIVESNTPEIIGEMKPEGSQLLEKESKMPQQAGENDSSNSTDDNGLDAATVEVNGDGDRIHPSSMKSPDGGNDLVADRTSGKEDLSLDNEKRMEDQDILGGSKHRSILHKHNNDENLQSPVPDNTSPCALLSNEHPGLSVKGLENLDGHPVDTNCRDIPCTYDVKMDDAASVQYAEKMDKLDTQDETKPEDDEKVKALSEPPNGMMNLVMKGAGMAAVVGLGISIFHLRAKGRSEKGGKRGSKSCNIKQPPEDNHSSNHVEAVNIYPSDRLRL